MPRYGAKTYGGKGQRKDDKNAQFDELWAKSQGSKIPVPEFSPVKQSPDKNSAKTHQPLRVDVGAISPSRHYHTRSSPVKPGSNSPGPGMRRTRSNSSVEDPFSFRSDDEPSKSPVRKSSRLTRNNPVAESRESDSLEGGSRLKRSNQMINSKAKSSASNSDSSKDMKGKKQASLLKYVKVSPNNEKDAFEKKNSVAESDKTPSVSDSNTASGLFTDGFGSPPLSATSSLSDDVVLLSSPDLPTPTYPTTQGLHSYARSPERQSAVGRNVAKRTADSKGDEFVIKRKSRDLRTNGDVKVKENPSQHTGDKFEFEADEITSSQTGSKVDTKLGVKSESSFGQEKVSKQLSHQKPVGNSKDEFDFDEELSDNKDSSQSSTTNTNAEKPKPATGLVKKRSKEITGVTRRIFNSPKKSPVKARYNARSWTMSDSLEMEEESSLEESGSQSSNVSSSSGVSSGEKKPVPSTSKSGPRGKVPALTRSVNYPKKINHSMVTSLKCQKQDKKYFTVVKHVKQAHQCQESGESQQYSDDIEYLLDGLKSNVGNATKCLSTISLVEKSTVPSFRMHLRAHSTIARIFTALKDAAEDPCLALCTSGLMYMLSKDRLNMDLDRNSLSLLVQLLSIDSESILSQRTPEEKEEYQKTRARLWGIVKNAAKGSSTNQLFGIDEQTLSSGFFAMESLLSLTSKRSGEWFKEELRFAGGLEHMANTVAKVTETVSSANTDPAKIDLVHLRTLNRCVRVLENVTFMNTDNQQYLLELNDLKLIKALACFLSLCEKHIEVCSADSEDPNSQEANLSKLVIQGLLANLRLLLNLTHDNEWGSMKIGEQEGLMFTVLQCVLQLPQFLPKDQRFDLLVLSLGLLINLVEHNVTNARILTMMKTNHSYDSQPVIDLTDSEDSNGEVSSISALTELFLQRQQAAIKLENQTENDEDDEEVPSDAHNDIDDWITVEAEPVANNSGGIQPTQEEIKQSIRKALHTAGRHMEDSIVASYAALLLGCLLRENKLNVKKVRDCLPNGDFSCMVNMLKKLLSFMELTDADGTTGQKSISKVIEVLECC